jgi:hypothetical protein
MPRTGRTYEKPSRISQGLVVCLSIAVVLMAGWLAVTIMLSNYATTSAVVDTNMASAPVQMDDVSAEPEKPGMAPRANSDYFEPPPRDFAPTTSTSPRSALPPASLGEPPAAAIRDPGYAPWSLATAAPEVSIPALSPYLPPRAPSLPPRAPYPASRASSLPSPAGRGGPERGQLGQASIDAAEAIADLMRPPPAPSPSPPPRTAEGRVGTAPVPVPRPRPPRLESEDVQPVAEDQPSFDFLVDRRR